MSVISWPVQSFEGNRFVFGVGGCEKLLRMDGAVNLLVIYSFQILRERVNNIRNNLRKEGIEEDGFPEEEETNEDGDNKEQISSKEIILEKL